MHFWVKECRLQAGLTKSSPKMFMKSKYLGNIFWHVQKLNEIEKSVELFTFYWVKWSLTVYILFLILLVFFVFSELLRSQNNLSVHKPKICVKRDPFKEWTIRDCMTNPTFSAAGPQVSSLSRWKLNPAIKRWTCPKWKKQNDISWILHIILILGLNQFWPASLLYLSVII